MAAGRPQPASSDVHRESVSGERSALGDQDHRGPEPAIGNDLIYERRIGARTQFEIVAPIDFQQSAEGSWTRGLGDVAFAVKRTLHASHERGRIVSGGLEIVVPTGEDTVGLGNGVTVIEPFAMWGQVLPGGAFLQMHGGAELPTDYGQEAARALPAHARSA